MSVLWRLGVSCVVTCLVVLVYNQGTFFGESAGFSGIFGDTVCLLIVKCDIYTDITDQKTKCDPVILENVLFVGQSSVGSPSWYTQ